MHIIIINDLKQQITIIFIRKTNQFTKHKSESIKLELTKQSPGLNQQNTGGEQTRFSTTATPHPVFPSKRTLFTSVAAPPCHLPLRPTGEKHINVGNA